MFNDALEILIKNEISYIETVLGDKEPDMDDFLLLKQKKVYEQMLKLLNEPLDEVCL